jgi:hypothetical protein
MEVDEPRRHKSAIDVDDPLRARRRDIRFERFDQAKADADVALLRRPWLGSSTSPPFITRSNLSFGPMAGVAARQLNLSASAVSHALRRLRRLLNDPLFLRTHPRAWSPPRATELA